MSLVIQPHQEQFTGRPFLNNGGGIPAGGTKNAGHYDWRVIINPRVVKMNQPSSGKIDTNKYDGPTAPFRPAARASQNVGYPSFSVLPTPAIFTNADFAFKNIDNLPARIPITSLTPQAPVFNGGQSSSQPMSVSNEEQTPVSTTTQPVNSVVPHATNYWNNPNLPGSDVFDRFRSGRMMHRFVNQNEDPELTHKERPVTEPVNEVEDPELGHKENEPVNEVVPHQNGFWDNKYFPGFTKYFKDTNLVKRAKDRLQRVFEMNYPHAAKNSNDTVVGDRSLVEQNEPAPPPIVGQQISNIPAGISPGIMPEGTIPTIGAPPPPPPPPQGKSMKIPSSKELTQVVKNIKKSPTNEPGAQPPTAVDIQKALAGLKKKKEMLDELPDTKGKQLATELVKSTAKSLAKGDEKAQQDAIIKAALLQHYIALNSGNEDDEDVDQTTSPEEMPLDFGISYKPHVKPEVGMTGGDLGVTLASMANRLRSRTAADEPKPIYTTSPVGSDESMASNSSGDLYTPSPTKSKKKNVNKTKRNKTNRKKTRIPDVKTVKLPPPTKGKKPRRRSSDEYQPSSSASSEL